MRCEGRLIHKYWRSADVSSAGSHVSAPKATSHEPIPNGVWKTYRDCRGGITGLVAGALLAKLGHVVQVLEANPRFLGGHARTFEIEGLRFSAGPQYVWDFHDDKIGYRVLRFLGLDPNSLFVEMRRDSFERFFVGEEKEGFNVPMGLDQFRRALTARFPREEKQIHVFFDVIHDLFAAARVVYDKGLHMHGGLRMSLGIFLSRDLSFRQKVRALRRSRWTLAHLFDECNVSQEARRYLYGHGGILLENESTISAAIYAAATGLYHEGASLPSHGFPALLEGLVSVICESGGSVENGKRVTELVQERQHVTKVCCADGTCYSCDLVISNLSPRLTCGLLEGCNPKVFRYKPSHSVIGCFIGLRDYHQVNDVLAKRNYWWQDGRREVDYSQPDMTSTPGMLFVVSPTAKGIGHTERNVTDQSLTVFAPGNYGQARSAHESGEKVYEQLKAKIAKQILFTLEERLFPGVQDHIVFAHVLTPVDTEQEIGAEEGNAYGRCLTEHEIVRGPGSIHMVKNLHIACATVGFPGIAAGFNTAALIVKRITGVGI